METNSVLDLAEKTAQWIDETAKNKGENYAKNIRTNQIRNVFSHINRIRTKFRNKGKFDEEIEADLILLKPKLAYAAGRQKQIREFQKFMFDIIDAVVNSKGDKNKAIENFFALIEAIVAYHKFNGGKDN
ncbi:MAG: type III-A CRISPR-associated protein Csm2 [Candidatus Kapaibacteriota bacterium]|jgi:CRISPR-associated protein Csm2